MSAAASYAITPYALALASKPPGVQTLPIANREQWLAMRTQDVTASVIAGLVGVSPYVTAFGLHLEKAGLANGDAVDSEPHVSDDGNEIVLPPAARGNMREGEAIAMLQMLRPNWRISYPLGSYWRDPERRIGCTPDAMAIDPGRAGFGIIQVKSVAAEVYRDTWLDPDTRDVTPPIWIPVQALTEAMLTGASWAVVAVHRENYGSRPSLRIIDIPLHAALWDRLQAEVALFWQRIDAGTPPDPDYNRDGDMIRRLFAVSDGTILDIEGDKAAAIAEIVASREKLKVTEKAGSEAARERRELDDRIIFALGNAEAGRLPDGTLITARTTNRKTYTVHASSYRTVAVSQKGTTP